MRARKRILSISYDESLLTTRKLLLEDAGFDVVPAFGFAEAATICHLDHDFDLIVMGHSIPKADKVALVEMLRQHCETPLLCLHRATESPIPEAEFSVNSADGPEVLIKTVKAALLPKPSSSVSSSAVPEKTTSLSSTQFHVRK